MLNILATEWLKLRRNKLMLVCTLLASLLPILMLVQEIYDYRGAEPNYTVISWVFRFSLLFQVIVYPVLSGFIITFLLQKEYGDHTMINTLTAPVSRIKFLTGKIIVWTVWHVIITIIFLIVICSGVRILYGGEMLSDFFAEIASLVLKIGVFNLGTLTPIIWVAILQRKTFYPSLLCTIAAAGIGFSGLYWPELLGSSIPWSAVVLVSVPDMDVISPLAYISIGICTLLGLLLAMICFKRQEI